MESSRTEAHLTFASSVPSSEPWGSLQGKHDFYSTGKTLVLTSVIPGRGSRLGQFSSFSRAQLMIET